jgi:gamma-glutamyltranspeptidase/glutathione hydrolase
LSWDIIHDVTDWRAQFESLSGQSIVADPYRAGRGMAVGRRGMVATAQPLATQAGLTALRAGGTAMDSAIAAAAVLAVVEPAMTGLGGDVFLLYFDAASNTVLGLNGSGRSPSALTAADLQIEGGAIKPHSWSAVTVPGAVDAWVTAHQRCGRLPLPELLAPAIEYARNGFAVTEAVARDWQDFAQVLNNDEQARKIFLPDGAAPQVGHLFLNHDLARSLEAIAQGGRDAFYDGDISAEILQYSDATGGYLCAADLRNHRSQWVDPISCEFHGYRVHQIPPNDQGLTVLLMLNILAGYPLADMPLNSAEYLHLLIEAKKLAYADSLRFICDPEWGPIPLHELLSDDHARQQSARINNKQAAIDSSPLLRLGTDTTLLVAADSDGNAVSFINSIAAPFGAGIVGGRSGILLQNRGFGFSLDADHANCYAPCKRPFHTIIPGMVTVDDRLYMTYGLMGGPMQPQGHVQLLLAHLCHGLSPQQAIDMPRWQHIEGRQVLLEHGIAEPVAAALAERGHKLGLSDCRPFGGAQAILLGHENGAYLGASDPRKDGCALGY